MQTRTRIKICGITNLDDARAAVEYGADALGFIFVPQTPRFVGAGEAIRQVFDALPPFVSRVGVCLDPAQITPALSARLTAVQFYSDGCDPDSDAKLDRIQVFRIRDEHSISEMEQSLLKGRRDAVLLDTFHHNKLGGSGETFNWELALVAKERVVAPLILAGGLAPGNVEEAIVKTRPFAVDVSSGVEAEPGRKDHRLLRAFIDAVRRADRRSA